jgi:5'-deoxynucleotidase YfbR-like HD superfamily hydrolase
MIPNLNNKILELRAASNVKRCHTLDHHGEYTVGKHSYDCVVLLLELNPNASRELIRELLYHDVAERWTGDMPCVAYWGNGALERTYEEAQAQAMAEHGIPVSVLTEEEEQWLHAIDKLELWLWAQDQTQRWSNLSALPVLERLEEWFANHKVPVPISNFISTYQWRAL